MYVTDGYEIHHFDFYRLNDAGIVADELAEVAGDPHAVVVVEWGDVVQHVLPDTRLTVRFKQTPTGERELTFTAPTELNYLLEAVKK
jgi:tRNA A37 threonylcarbamoyladenosine biosynthesis protein TsaE